MSKGSQTTQGEFDFDYELESARNLHEVVRNGTAEALNFGKNNSQNPHFGTKLFSLPSQLSDNSNWVNQCGEMIAHYEHIVCVGFEDSIKTPIYMQAVGDLLALSKEGNPKAIFTLGKALQKVLKSDDCVNDLLNVSREFVYQKAGDGTFIGTKKTQAEFVEIFNRTFQMRPNILNELQKVVDLRLSSQEYKRNTSEEVKGKESSSSPVASPLKRSPTSKANLNQLPIPPLNLASTGQKGTGKS